MYHVLYQCINFVISLRWALRFVLSDLKHVVALSSGHCASSYRERFPYYMFANALNYIMLIVL